MGDEAIVAEPVAVGGPGVVVRADEEAGERDAEPGVLDGDQFNVADGEFVKVAHGGMLLLRLAGW